MRCIIIIVFIVFDIKLKNLTLLIVNLKDSGLNDKAFQHKGTFKASVWEFPVNAADS